jgi:hypothetical protein
MLATHPDRPAMTGGQTPHRSASPSRARLAFIAHPRLPLAAFDVPLLGPASLISGEASCVTQRWVRSPLRRSTWDFWPGPVLAVVLCPRVADIGAARLRPLCEGLSGHLGSPSGIVRLSSHGSSLPEGAGLASLPGTVASRYPRTPRPRPPSKDRLMKRPSWTRLARYVAVAVHKSKSRIRDVVTGARVPVPWARPALARPCSS